MHGPNSLTAERLRQLLSYDPETGEFARLTPTRGRPPGSRVGSRGSLGYIQIGIDGKDHFGHRLAWLHVTGEWPKETIDHINGDRADNRWVNLRDVRHRVNIQNVRKARSDSKSGLLGACWVEAEGKWLAQIKAPGRRAFIGYFATAEAAHNAYLAAKRESHEGCTL